MSISQILTSLSDGISFALSQLSAENLMQINEIRLRREMPLIIVLGRKSYFITQSGKLINHYTEKAYITHNDEFDLIFKRLCNYSIHCEIDNLKNGFITADGGNRIGVCSTAVTNNGIITSVKDISSLNIRIANEVKNCARPVMNILYSESLPSIIVAAQPSGGKTTFLRDFSRLLSSGFSGCYRKVVIVDERNEIAYKNGSVIIADIGLNTDVITGFSKEKGIEIAVRTLAPEMIICDEITSNAEVEKIADGFLSGVSFAVSVHASDLNELMNKSIVKSLINTGEFRYIVLLKDYTNSFEIMEVEHF
jgi:stage III sporulation protein AA